MLNWLSIAAINMVIAVALGAFGAHGLKDMVSTQQLEWWPLTQNTVQAYSFSNTALKRPWEEILPCPAKQHC